MTADQWILIIGMAIVTFASRFFPVLFFAKRKISPALSRWMTYIPVSVFAALVASDIFFWEESFQLHPLQNIKLLPSLVVFIIAYKTKSLLWSMVVGILGITILWLAV